MLKTTQLFKSFIATIVISIITVAAFAQTGKPTQITWGSFISANGGSGSTYQRDLCTDAIGNVYGVGYAKGFSSAPVTGVVTSGGVPTYQTVFAGGTSDGYIYKLSADGSSLQWWTFLGGGGMDDIWGVEYSQEGSNEYLYIAGYTNANITIKKANKVAPLETDSVSVSGNYQNGYDGFLAKIDAKSGAMVWFNWISTPNINDAAYTIKVSDNYVHVAGVASQSLATTNGAYKSTISFNWIYDGFYARYDKDGSKNYMTYVGFQHGQNSVDGGNPEGKKGVIGMEVINDNDVLLAGTTKYESGGGTGSITNEVSPIIPTDAVTTTNNPNGYVMRLKVNTSTVPFATRIRATAASSLTNAVDVKYNGGAIYVLGMTNGVIAGIPSTAYQKKNNGATDAYVLKIDASNYTIASASMYGGNGIEYVGNLNVCTMEPTFSGQTYSTDLPIVDYLRTDTTITPTLNMNSYKGNADMFVAAFKNTFDVLTLSSYLGGTGLEHPYDSDVLGKTGGHALKGGNLLIGTATHSKNDMPTTVGAWRPVGNTNVSTSSGDLDYVVSFKKKGASCSILTTNPPTLYLDFPGDSAGAVASVNYKKTYFELDGVPVNIGNPKSNGVSIIDTDSPNLVSATITLTNTQTSDVFEWVGSLPSGITPSITKSGSSTIITLTGSASKSDYETAIKQIYFSNSSNNPSGVDRIVTVTVNDGFDSSPIATTTIKFILYNSNPTIDLDADDNSGKKFEDYQTNYSENNSAVGITDTDLLIIDDEINLDTATIVLTNYIKGDAFSIAGILPAGISAKIDTTSKLGQKIIILSGTATIANYVSAIKLIKYSTNSDTLIADKVIQVTVNDGSKNSNLATSYIHFIPKNDCPKIDLDTTTIGNDNALTYNENDGKVKITKAVKISDVDKTAQKWVAQIVLTNKNSLDSLFAPSSANGFIVSLPNYSVATKITIDITGTGKNSDLANLINQITYKSGSENPVTTTRVVTVEIKDDSLCAAKVNSNITIKRLNDCPVINLNNSKATNFTTTFTENKSAVKIASGSISIIDPDNTTQIWNAVVTLTNSQALDVLTVPTTTTPFTASKASNVITITGTGTNAQLASLISNITYSSTSENPNTTPRLITVAVSDSFCTAKDTSIVIVESKNDCIVIGLNGTTLKTYSTIFNENGAPLTLVGSGITIEDKDKSSQSLVAKIKITNAEASDSIAIPTSANGFLVSKTVLAGDSIIVNITGNGLNTDLATLISSITFQSVSKNPSTVSRIVSISIKDDSLCTDNGTATIAINPSNDAPTLDLDASDNTLGVIGGTDFSTTFTENDLNLTVNIVDTDVIVSDVDNANISNATINFTNVKQGDNLIIGTLPAGITSSVSNSLGNITITLSGSASKAEYETALKSIVFVNNRNDVDETTRVITFEVNDGDKPSNTATTYIKVVNINDTVIVVNDYVTTNEDVKIINPLSTITANDVDPDNDLILVTLLTNSKHGNIIINGTNYEYTPNPFYFGGDTAIFNLCDAKGACKPDTLFITVDPVNNDLILDLNTADGSSNKGNKGTFTEGGTEVNVSTNFNSIFNPDNIDIENAKFIITNRKPGDTLIINGVLPVGVSSSIIASVGSLTLTITGKLDSTAYKNILKQIQFKNDRDDVDTSDRYINVTVANANGNSNIAVDTIEVININDLPIVSNESIITDEDVPYTNTLAVLLSGDKDPDGEILSVKTIENKGKNGEFTIVGNNFVYTPNANFNGKDTVELSVCDTRGGCVSKFVYVTVNPINDAPILDLDSNNSTAIGNDYFTIYNEDSSGVSIADIDDKITDVDDSTMESAIIKLVNTKVGDVIKVNGTLPTGITSTSSTNGSETIITLTGFATLDDYEKAIKQIEFSSTLDTLDPTDRIVNVVLNDGDSTSNIAVTTIKIKNINDNPVPTFVSISTPEDSTKTGSIKIGDLTSLIKDVKDPEGKPVFVCGIVKGASNGTFTTTDTSYTYVPNPDYNGKDSVVISVCDSLGGKTEQVIYINVTPVNDPAELDLDKDNSSGKTLADYITTFVEGPSSVNINDQDISIIDIDNSNIFSAKINLINTKAFDSLVVGTLPAGLSFTKSKDKDSTIIVIKGKATLFNYEQAISQIKFLNTSENPDTNRRFVYVTVFDSLVNSNLAITTILVNRVNDAPIVRNETITVIEDTPYTALLSTLLENDSDVDGDTLTIKLITNATRGTITYNNNSYTYFPLKDSSGTDYAIFSVCDKAGSCKNDTLFINVNPVNDEPIVKNEQYNVLKNSSNNQIEVLKNDTDVETKPILGETKLFPLHGKVNNTNGKLTYTPDRSYIGFDTIIFNVCDQGFPLEAICKYDTVFINVLESNTCTEFDLDTKDSLQTGKNYEITYTENDGAVPIIGKNFKLYDIDNVLKSVTVTLKNTQIGDSLILNPVSLKNINSSVISENGNWIVKLESDLDANNEPIAEVKFFITALNSIRFKNNLDDINTIRRDIIVQVNDGVCIDSGITYVYVEDERDYSIINNEFYITNEDESFTRPIIDITLRDFKPLFIPDYSPDGDSVVFLENQGSDTLILGTKYKFIKGKHGVFVYLDSTFTYIPDPNFNGNDTIIVTTYDYISRDKKYSDYIFITVLPVIDTLKVFNESYPVNQGKVISGLSITANDKVFDAGAYIYVSTIGTGKKEFIGDLGTLVIDSLGGFTYTSTKGFGKDEFHFDVCSNGICKKDTLTIQVIGLPDGFSPATGGNGDGINDNYKVEFPESYGKVNLQVFNRWGSLVFESSDYKNEWDGTSNRGITIGSELPDGTYFIEVHFEKTSLQIKPTAVTLLR